jgi:peptide chain release factor subunit 3
MAPPNRKLNGPVMLPVSEKYKDMGTVIVGKLESGRVRKGDPLLMMPNHVTVEAVAIYNELEEEVPSAFSGDNIRIRLRGVDDEDISPGFVLTSPGKPVHTVRQFIAQLAILEHKSIICAGYSAVMHVHTLAEEVNLLVRNNRLFRLFMSLINSTGAFTLSGQKNWQKIEETSAIREERYGQFMQSCAASSNCSQACKSLPRLKRQRRYALKRIKLTHNLGASLCGTKGKPLQWGRSVPFILKAEMHAKESVARF